MMNPRGAKRTNRDYSHHQPVMVETVIDLLLNDPSGTYLDATAGGGGHTIALLRRLSENGKIIALDKDIDAMTELTRRFQTDSRVTPLQADFRYIGSKPEIVDAAPLAGVLFDFGVSSHMLDEPQRGFSHRSSGLLDMRMDQGQELNADMVVNHYDENRLAQVLKDYGEELRSKRVAAEIVKARPVKNTLELAAVIRGTVPVKDESKTVARVFQAIRIEVNDELSAIRETLPEAVKLLKPGGRLVTMAYHSLEDRIVKRFISDQSRECICPPRLVVCNCGGKNATLKPVVKGAIKAGKEECESNSRSHSVRIRAAEKIR